MHHITLSFSFTITRNKTVFVYQAIIMILVDIVKDTYFATITQMSKIVSHQCEIGCKTVLKISCVEQLSRESCLGYSS